jgi:predicted O-methyltransferase YrrM
VSKEKYSRLLFRLCDAFRCKTIIELGTSIGLNTLYLAAANKNAQVYTLEGSSSLCGFAKKLFQVRKQKNIELIEGNFDSTFENALNKIDQLDFLFLDGNHKKEPTLHYFNQALSKIHNDSLIVLDDIYWSEEMEQAWTNIKSNPRVTMTIDLFQVGLVFFRSENKIKENFILKF